MKIMYNNYVKLKNQHSLRSTLETMLIMCSKNLQTPLLEQDGGQKETKKPAGKGGRKLNLIYYQTRFIDTMHFKGNEMILTM